MEIIEVDETPLPKRKALSDRNIAICNYMLIAITTLCQYFYEHAGSTYTCILYINSMHACPFVKSLC